MRPGTLPDIAPRSRTSAGLLSGSIGAYGEGRKTADAEPMEFAMLNAALKAEISTLTLQDKLEVFEVNRSSVMPACSSRAKSASAA